MTYVATTRPTSLYAAGAWRTQAGATVADATQVNDNSDATYVTDTAPGTTLVYGMAAPAGVPGFAQLRQFQIRLRDSQAAGTGKIRAWFDGSFQVGPVGGPGPTFSWQSQQVLLTPAAAIATQSAPAEQVLGGSATFNVWARLSIKNESGAVEDHRVYEAYVDWTFNEAPVVSAVVLSPATANLLTSRPPIGWTYTDPENDAQERYRVKIFNAAQYGAVGFDPEGAVADWDSGEVYSANPSAVPAFDLVNGTTYKVYVKAADAGSGGRYGAWAGSAAFTQAVQLPAAPTVVVTPTVDASGGTYQNVAIQPHLNLLLSADSADFENGIASWAGDLLCTVAQSAAWAASGTKSLAVTATGAGNPVARSGVAASAVPVDPTTQYTATALLRAATVGRNVAVGLRWFTAAGALVSEAYGANVADLASGAGVLASYTVVSPATAAFAVLLVKVTAAALNEVHYIDQAQIAYGAVTTWTRGGLNGASHQALLERSVDAGATWVAPYGAVTLPTPPTNGGPVTFNDYTAPPGQTATYRTRSGSLDGTYVLVSAYSALASGATPASGWYLRDPTAPSLNMALSVQSWRQTSTETQGVFYGLGSTYPVVLRDAIQSEHFQAVLNLMSTAAWAAFVSLRARQRTLLVQTDLVGTQYWVSIDADRDAELLNSANRKTKPARFTSVSFTEVAQPEG